MSELATFAVIGVAAGSIYGLAAIGLVLTHSASGVFNFAQGAIGALGAFAFYDLVERGVAWPVALVLCTVGLGVALGLVLEPLMRALERAPIHLRIVATVGLTLAVQDAILWRWGADARFTAPFLPTRPVSVAGVNVGTDQLILLAFGAAATLALTLGLHHTPFGTRLRALVDDADLLSETGANPVHSRQLAWCTGSGFAIVSGILVAPRVGLDAVVLTMVVVQAFAAAAIGAFRSIPLTYGGGLLLGVVASLSVWRLGPIPAARNLPAAVPFLALYLALHLRRERGRDAPTETPQARAHERGVVAHGLAAVVLLVGLAVRYPALVPVLITAAALATIFMALAFLINASGQVSLGHAALAAVGAVAMSRVASELPWVWFAALLFAGCIAAAVGALAALPSLHLAGLPLALATFAFGLVVSSAAYNTEVMFGIAGERSVVRPTTLGLSTDRGYLALSIVVATLAALALHRLDRGPLGRRARAMSDHPGALAALGISPLTTRAVVFAVAAFFAGTGGALLAGANGAASASSFQPDRSLLWVAVVAIGGHGVVTCGIRGALAGTLIPYYLVPIVGDRVALLFGLGALIISLRRARPEPLVAPAAPRRGRRTPRLAIRPDSIAGGSPP